MARDDSQLSGRVALNVTEFRKGIADMGRNLRVLKSEWDANAAALGDWTKDISGVESRLAVVTKSITAHQQKVDLLSQRYGELVAEQGAESSAAQNMLISLNRATKELNAAQHESGELENRLQDLKEAEGDTGSESGKLKTKLGSLSSGVKSLMGGLANAARAAAPLIGKLKDIGHAAVAATGKLVAATAKAAKAVAVNLAKIGAALVVGVGVLLATTIGPASDLSETLSKAQVVFGESADAVIAFGNDAAASLGLSANAAVGAAATYGNLLTAMGLSEAASADMSTSLVQLAGDLASFNNLETADVLEKLRAGLTGETEPLKTLGINMNQARLEAKALELGLIKQGDSLDAAAKAQAAYAIMMEDTSKAQGDFARTSGGLANQQRIFGANMENLRAKIGSGLLPIATALVTKFNEVFGSDTVQNAIASITENLGHLGAGISGLLNGTVSLDTVTTLFKNLFSGVSDSLSSGLGDFDLGAFLGKMLSGIGGLATKLNLGSLALDIITGLVDSIVTGLPGLIVAAQGIIEKMVEFITDGIPKLIEAAIPLVLAILNGIVQALPLIIGAADKIISALITGLVSALPTLIPAAISAILLLATALISNLPVIIGAAVSIITALVSGLAEMLPELIPVAVAAILQIVTTLGENLPLILDAAIQIILALVGGLADLLPTLIPVAIDILMSLINTLIENLPLIIDAALQLITALVLGLIAALPVLITATPDIITAIVDTLVENFPAIKDAALLMIETLAQAAIDALPELIEAGKSLLTSFVSLFSSPEQVTQILSVGSGIVNKIWTGIQNAKDWFVKQVRAFFSSIIDEIKDALGLGGTDMGADMAGNFMSGFVAALPQIRADMNLALGRISVGNNSSLAGAAAASTTNYINITLPLQIYGKSSSVDQVRIAANEGVLRALRAAGVR